MAIAGVLAVSGLGISLTGQVAGILCEDPNFIGSDCFN
jgi:hypothetical protein